MAKVEPPRKGVLGAIERLLAARVRELRRMRAATPRIFRPPGRLA